MSVTQNSKILVRTGLFQNLPLLDQGEFGWCVDTLQLFIGNGNVQGGAPYQGNTEILTATSNLFTPIPVSGIPSGNANSSNQIFSIPSIPILGSLLVWQNVPLIPNIGYTINGTTITFTTPPTPSDNLYYQYLAV